MSGSATPISLVIGATTWTNWTSYEVDADFVSPADTWSVEVHNPSAPQLAALVTGTPVVLMVGSAVAMRGLLERKEIRRTASAGTVVALSGRDLAAPLIDCSPPASWGYTNTPLAAVAQAALTELGVAGTVSAAPEAQQPRGRIKTEPGETYWNLIERHAKKLRLMVWMTPEGILQLGRPDYLSAPVGTLVHGARGGNVLEASYSEDLAGRFTDVTVVGQFAGTDDAFGAAAGQVKGTAQDSELRARGLYRPTTIDDGDVESSTEARARAAWEVSNRAFAAQQLQYMIAGHEAAPGVLWAPNQQVVVRDELVGITGTWWISGRRFTRDRAGGTRTALSLRPPGLLLPAIP